MKEIHEYLDEARIELYQKMEEELGQLTPHMLTYLSQHWTYDIVLDFNSDDKNKVKLVTKWKKK